MRIPGGDGSLIQLGLYATRVTGYISKYKKAASMVSAVGERVLSDGVYTVTHHGHRGSHKVILNAGENFPPCNICKDRVIFEFACHVGGNPHNAEHIRHDRDFTKTVAK